jgi:Ca2+-binding RTX toxin-like protein
LALFAALTLSAGTATASASTENVTPPTITGTAAVGQSLGAGQTLTVSGSSATSLTFNGAAETNGSFVFISGNGNDALTGGAGNDTFTPGTGNDTINASAGNDTIVMAANLTAVDVIDGAAGSDSVTLAGNYSAGLTFSATTMVNVETLSLATGFSYSFTTNDATVAAGSDTDGEWCPGATTLTFNAAARDQRKFQHHGARYRQ